SHTHACSLLSCLFLFVSSCALHPLHSFPTRRSSDLTSVVHTGTYREIDRPHRLVFTWSSPATHFRDSIVTVTFQPSSNSSTVVEDRKSTRLNSSHGSISYAVFCLKKKKNRNTQSNVN